MTLPWQAGDRIFERLVEVGDGMSEDDARAFLARLVLVLANEVGDEQRVLAAIDTALASGTPPAE